MGGWVVVGPPLTLSLLDHPRGWGITQGGPECPGSAEAGARGEPCCVCHAAQRWPGPSNQAQPLKDFLHAVTLSTSLALALQGSNCQDFWCTCLFGDCTTCQEVNELQKKGGGCLGRASAAPS